MTVMKCFVTTILLSLIFIQANAQSPEQNVDKQLVQFFQNQQYAKAAAYLQPIARDNKKNQHYLSLLGYAYYMSNQYARAASSFMALLTEDSLNSRAFYYLGKMAAESGDIPRALNYFCRLVELQPGIAGYYKQLAVLWRKMGNHSASGFYYAKAYQANPNDASVISSLASYWVAQERYHLADSILDIALQKDSMQAGILTVRIFSAYAQEDYQEIFPLAQVLEKMHFIELKPFTYTGIAYFQLKKYDSCIAICELLQRNKMQTQTSMYLEALACRELKQYKKALGLLNTCLAMALDDAADKYFTVKGKILELMHQPSNALKQYDTAYYIFHHPTQIYNKAQIYDAQFNNYKAALRYYHRYLKHEKVPKDENTKKITAFVHKRVEQLEKWKEGQ